METVDILITAGWLVPIEPVGAVHRNWSVAVRDGRIVGVGPADDLATRYAAAKTLRRPSHVLLPGFINAHTHSPLTLMRGLADDLPLMQWLSDAIWPAEQEALSPAYVRAGTELAIAEMLRGGTTCFVDQYYYPDVIARTASELGMRANVGPTLINMETPWAATEDEYLDKGLAVRDAFKHDPLVNICLSPHGPYTASDDLLRRVQQLSSQLDESVHIHLHETAGEIRESLQDYGQRPIARLARLGLLGPQLQAVHMTQVTEMEIAQVASTGVHIVHCPRSNQKLASGVAPVQAFLEAGINVALGTDSAASNNDLSMLGEIRAAALQAKQASGSSAALDAHTALRMATVHAARMLGRDDDLGTVEEGKWADLVCIDLDRLNTQPVYDAARQLVYAATADQVSDVWVAGRQQLDRGELTRIDAASVTAKAREWRNRLARFASGAGE